MTTNQHSNELKVYFLYIIAIVWSAFQICTLFVPVDSWLLRLLHTTFGLVFALTLHARSKNQGYIHTLFALFLLGVSILALFDIERISTRRPFVDPVTNIDVLSAILFIVSVLYVTKLCIGTPLFTITLFFLFYGFLGCFFPKPLQHRGFDLTTFTEYIYLIPEGIFSIPIGASASYVFYFLLFAAFLEKTGGGVLFKEIALSIGKNRVGGAAKASVIGSSLFGMISGSVTANVASTGSITIPLMRRSGFTPTMAGAIEAVASTGGQIMPPVMGASAFVMAELLGIPYAQVILVAIIPSLLYYTILYTQIDAFAKKYNIRPIEEYYSIKSALLKRGNLLIGPVALVLLIIWGYTPSRAAFIATLLLILASFVKKETRLGYKDALEAFKSLGEMSSVVVAACASAGVITCVLSFSNLDLKFSSFLVKSSGGNFFLIYPVFLLTALLLGMGMPTTAAYVTVASLQIPALVKLGIQPIVAHMAALYYSCLSMITPPVAIAAYVASSIAREDPIKIGFTAFKLGIGLLIVPLIFILNQDIILFSDVIESTISTLIAFVSCYLVGLALGGYMMGKEIGIISRLALLVTGALLIYPPTRILGIVLTSISITMQLLLKVSKQKEDKKSKKI